MEPDQGDKALAPEEVEDLVAVAMVPVIMAGADLARAEDKVEVWDAGAVSGIAIMALPEGIKLHTGMLPRRGHTPIPRMNWWS
jgi:hypothetical protein